MENCGMRWRRSGGEVPPPGADRPCRVGHPGLPLIPHFTGAASRQPEGAPGATCRGDVTTLPDAEHP